MEDLWECDYHSAECRIMHMLRQTEEGWCELCLVYVIESRGVLFVLNI